MNEPERRARMALAWGVGDPMVLPRIENDLDSPGRTVRERIAACLTWFPPHLDGRAALQAVDDAMTTHAGPLAALEALADLVTGRLGDPRLPSREVWGPISAVVDLDALVVVATLRMAGARPVGPEHLLWPAVARPAVLATPIEAGHLDLHVHLAGAVPATVAWLEVRTGRVPIGRALALDDPEHVARWERWMEAAGQAAASSDLRAFDSSLAPGGPDGLAARLLEERARLLVLLGSVSARTVTWDRPHPWRTYLGVKSAFLRALQIGPGARGLARFQARLARHRGSAWIGFGSGRAPDRQAEAGRVEATVEAGLLDVGTQPDEGRWALIAPYGVEVRVFLPPAGDRWRLRAMLLGLRRVVQRFTGPLRVGLVHQLSKSRVSVGSSIERQIQALLCFVADYPDLRPLVVGVDAAGDELGASPRTFTRGYRALAASGAGLRRTFHVGEEFRDLLTGVRHVFEATTLLDLRRGDRLGHALALFWGADAWYGRSVHGGPDPLPTLGQHLLDLAWWVARGEGPSVAIARGRLHRLLEGLPGRPSGDRLSAIVAAEDESGEPVLLGRAGLDDRVRRSHAVVIDDAWLRLVDDARAFAERAVSLRRLVVEVNPTSNLMVGGLTRYADLPWVHRLAAEGVTLLDRVPLVVGTDDPGVFQTSASHEFAVVQAALVSRGVHAEQATSLVRRLHETARTATFLSPLVPDAAHLDALLGRVLAG